ncbi:hypothetical protein KQI18_02070 [Clostridioides mangenotii]|uniref:hypothetical protein n=1 Tax=Metaclostridioides mangenotii TaxID=1540 RepID=UPI001C0FCB85|nr:hypothetical protein [Clostridioides mangenotii]MBU5306561.1 hypothetical protein [Clostridioides mangenotii]
MNEKSYKEALNELKTFVTDRKEMVIKAEDCIDRYIVDRSLPLEYKDKCVEWQQELADVIEKQLSQAKELAEELSSKIND